MDKIIFLPSKDIFFNFFYKRLDSINITKEELEVLIGKNCKQLFDVIYNRFKLFKSEYYNKDNNVQIITGHYCQFFLFYMNCLKFYMIKIEKT